MSDNDTSLSTKGLDDLIKLFSKSPPVARVGILGNNAARTDGMLNNAEVGAFHEFGTENLPVRSFLRVPIAENLDKKLESSGLFDEAVLKEAASLKDLKPIMEKVAIVAQGISLESFDTGGFGKWKPSDMSHKKNHQTLVETQQLRNAVTYDVKEGSE